MIEAREFAEAARARGLCRYAGVPCSFLTPFINFVLEDPGLAYVSMANEGDAVALNAGVALAADGGRPRRTVTLMQNSGRGNAVSPFPTDPAAIGGVLDRAIQHMDATGRPYALLMQKGSVATHALEPGYGRAAKPPPAVARVGRLPLAPQARPTRGEALRQALDLALARPALRVIALDGDGAALMRMGALATVGACAPRNLMHLLLDNGVHDSTGGQATVSRCLSFAGSAAACGCAEAIETDDVDEIGAWLDSRAADGPRFARLLIRPGTPHDLPRPSITPLELRTRLMQHLARRADS